MASVIQVEGLRKNYRRLNKPPVLALAGLSFSVESGGVFGFLGPNGSGKTTTIRCLLGLAPDFQGSAKLFGADVRTSLPSVINRVGAIVEQPALFGGFTGKRNLEILGRIDGIGSSRITEAIRRVGLEGREDELVKGYSLGMRQRLAIAAALLKDPELLILDEPANGLDPSGIKEVRNLLRGLAAEGRTVFVSSHLLSEVQQVADHVAILRRGKCVAQGSVDEVLAGGTQAGVLVRIEDMDAARSHLTEEGFVVTDQDPYLLIAFDPNEAASIAKTLASKNLYPTEMKPADRALEDAFIALTEDQDEVTA